MHPSAPWSYFKYVHHHTAPVEELAHDTAALSRRRPAAPAPADGAARPANARQAELEGPAMRGAIVPPLPQRTITVLGMTTIKTGYTRWGKPWELKKVDALDAAGKK